MAGRGRKDAHDELQPNPLLYVASFVLALVMAFVLSYVVDWAQADNVGEGLLVGFLAWLGFVATTKAVSTLYEGRSRNLYLLDVGYHLVELLVMGVILALWD